MKTFLKGKMLKKYLFFFLAFACVGMTTEIFFAALSDFFPKLQTGIISWKMQGKSYIWMFLIYGAGGIIFPLAIGSLMKIFFLWRVIIYAAGILLFEFIAGALLDFFIGQCPWEYKTGLHVMGYIRLDYFPAWAFFGFGLEKLSLFLEQLANGKGL